MRLAATVMLLRDADAGLEVLMVRRSSRSTFAPDAFVFPGGTVDEPDYTVEPPASSRLVQFRATVHDALPTTEPPINQQDAAALLVAASRELREEAAIELQMDALILFSHWITPPTEPRRYNTHFFVAQAGANTVGTADAYETHDAQWISPRAALERYAGGAMHLVYPTIKHLERLTSFSHASDVLDFARSKPIVTIMPDRAPSEGFVMPSQLEGAW